MKIVSSPAVGIIIVGFMCAGCDLLAPPAPQVKSGISKSQETKASTAPTNAIPTNGPKIWKRQTFAGVTFEAPFDVRQLSEAESGLPLEMRGQFSSIESFGGTYPSSDSSEVLRIQISRVKGSAQLAPNMESAMRKAIESTAQKLGDLTPQFSIAPAQFGGANGYISSYSHRSSSGKFTCFESVNAAAGDLFWMIQVGAPDSAHQEMAKKIIASISIQP